MIARSGLADRVRRALLALILATAVSTCGDSKTGPNHPVAIEFPPPELPSIVVGDQIRDTLGNIDSLRALIFNSTGDTIHDAIIRYIRADTGHVVTIDSVTGRVVAGTDTGFARVVAQAGGLQSPVETLFVVQRPDAFMKLAPLNDTTLEFTPLRTDTIFPLSVLATAGGVPVPHYRVDYRFAYQAAFNDSDSTHILLTDENRKVSFVDTTGLGTEIATGSATRYLRITPFAHPYDDSVVVEARAYLPDHTPVSGSPARFTVHVLIH